MDKPRLAKLIVIEALLLGVFLLGLKTVLENSRSRRVSDSAQSDSDEKSRSDNSRIAERDTLSSRSAAVPVEIARVRKQRIDTYLLCTCTLEAEAEVEVYAKTSGEVIKLFVEEGDLVKEGDPLAKLEDDEQKLNLEEARVRLENAKKNYERAKQILDKNIISPEEFDNTRLEYDTAKVQFEAAKLELEYTTIKAPITGTVTERLIDEGDMVLINQPVFRISDQDPLLAYLYVPEKDLHKIKPGRKVKVEVESLPGREFEGTVTLISPVVDPESGTVKVRVDLPNPPGTGLRPGMFATARLIVETHPQALVIPKKALIIESDRDEVFVARETVRLELPPEQVSRVKIGSKAVVKASVPPAEKSESEGGEETPEQTEEISVEGEVTSVIVPEEGEETGEVIVRLPDEHALKGGVPAKIVITTPDGEEIATEVESLDLRTQAVRTPVEIGFSEGNEAEILKGLAEGDRVVTVGNEELRNGTVIQIVAEETPEGKREVAKATPLSPASFPPRLQQLREKILEKPEVKEEYDKAVKADPEVASNPLKFMKFVRAMVKKGLVNPMKLRGRPERSKSAR